MERQRHQAKTDSNRHTVTIGEAVYTTRKEEGLTQLSLAILSGVSERYINHIEHDRRVPSLRILIKLADVFKREMIIHYKTGKKVISASFVVRDSVAPDDFTRLVSCRQIQERLYRDCLRMCTFNHDDAKDLAQDATVEALLHHNRYDAASSQVYTWLFGIARNIHCNDKKRARHIKYIDDYIETGLDVSDSAPEEKQRVKQLYQFIDTMPESQKQLYKLRLLGYSYNRISAETGKTAKAAKSKFWFIRKNLISTLETTE